MTRDELLAAVCYGPGRILWGMPLCYEHENQKMDRVDVRETRLWEEFGLVVRAFSEPPHRAGSVSTWTEQDGTLAEFRELRDFPPAESFRDAGAKTYQAQTHR